MNRIGIKTKARDASRQKKISKNKNKQHKTEFYSDLAWNILLIFFLLMFIETVFHIFYQTKFKKNTEKDRSQPDKKKEEKDDIYHTLPAGMTSSFKLQMAPPVKPEEKNKTSIDSSESSTPDSRRKISGTARNSKNNSSEKKDAEKTRDKKRINFSEKEKKIKGKKTREKESGTESDMERKKQQKPLDWSHIKL